VNPEETFEWTPVESNDCESLPPTINEIKQQRKRLKLKNLSEKMGFREKY